jgi:hypothetical protein
MHKSISGISVKSTDLGEVSAVFSTFNVIDKDGDVTLPGAIKDGTEVVMSAYGHKSWDGLLPVGKGVVRVTDTEAVLEAKFFLNTTQGRDTFEVVQELGSAQEWSYSLQDVVSKRGEFEGQQVNFLESINVKEVSPVLVGAGVNTRTLATKGLMSLQDQITEAMDVVAVVIDSAERVVALRAEKGKTLSNVNAESLGGLYAQMDRIKSLIDAAKDEESEQATSMEDIEAMAVAYRRAELFSSLTQTGAGS